MPSLPQFGVKAKPRAMGSMVSVLKSFLAGLAGTLAQMTLSFVKVRLGILPEFQPYESLQRALRDATGAAMSPWLAWALTFVNGALIWGFIFARIYTRLPGRTWLPKGLFFALCAWVGSGLLLLPFMGLGPFALGAGLGVGPALFMAAGLTIYSCVMSFAYSALVDDTRVGRSPEA